MDPWSKVDYSRHIREASMVVERSPEVNPPSGRVPRSGLLELPIFEARRRRNREVIAMRASPRGFPGRGVKIGRRGHQRLGPPPRRPGGVARGGAAPPGCLGGGSPPPSLL